MTNEYVYAALLIHKAGKKIDENTVKNVLTAAGANTDEARIKALIASLEGVNIDEAIEKASIVTAAPVQSAAAPTQEKKEEKKEDKKSEEQAAAGLGSLFG
jgi:large subunit ribosomal protein L12